MKMNPRSVYGRVCPKRDIFGGIRPWREAFVAYATAIAVMVVVGIPAMDIDPTFGLASKARSNWTAFRMPDVMGTAALQAAENNTKEAWPGGRNEMRLNRDMPRESADAPMAKDSFFAEPEATAPEPTTTPETKFKTHTVTDGEIFSRIVKNELGREDWLKHAVAMGLKDPDSLKIGQKLDLPLDLPRATTSRHTHKKVETVVAKVVVVKENITPTVPQPVLGIAEADQKLLPEAPVVVDGDFELLGWGEDVQNFHRASQIRRSLEQVAPAIK